MEPNREAVLAEKAHNPQPPTIDVACLCTFCANVTTWKLPKSMKGFKTNVCELCSVLTKGVKEVYFHSATARRCGSYTWAEQTLREGLAYHVAKVKPWQHGTNLALKEHAGNQWHRPEFDFKLFVPYGYEPPTEEKLEEAREFQEKEQDRLDRQAAGAPDGQYRICRDCEPAHYENCETCFGFGVFAKPSQEDGPIPVSAGDASRLAQGRDAEDGEVIACPECGSTVSGLPQAVGPTAEAGASA